MGRDSTVAVPIGLCAVRTPHPAHVVDRGARRCDDILCTGVAAGTYERALAAVTNLRTAPATDAEVERLTAEVQRLRTAIEQAMGKTVEAFNILRTALTPGAES